ncbi:MAG: Tryptophan halogenase, partial [uncultured Sphingomonadaceae bacterium]
RRNCGVDDRGIARQAAAPALHRPSGGIRSDRDRRRGRGHPAPHSKLQRTARHRRGRVHGRHPRHLQARDRVPKLGRDRRKLHPPIRRLRARLRRCR